MTRSAREALAKALTAVFNYREYELGDTDSVIALLSEEGWVVVPREPTKKMFDAGMDTEPTAFFDADEIYRAMLAAINGEGK